MEDPMLLRLQDGQWALYFGGTLFSVSTTLEEAVQSCKDNMKKE